jgi:HK97 family phage portal protein
MPVLEKFLARFKMNGNGRAPGLAPGEVPIINDGAGNRPSIRVTYGTGLGSASWTGRDYEARVREGYAKNSDVYSAVTLIAQAARQVRWDTEAGNRKTAEYLRSARKLLGKDIVQEQKWYPSDTAYTDYLRHAYNPMPSIDLLDRVGGAAFIEAWISSLLLFGNAYIEIERFANGSIGFLYLDNPMRITAKENIHARHEQDAVELWIYRNGAGESRPLKPYRKNTFIPEKGDLLQSKLFNPLHPVYGLAPLEAAMLSVDTQNEGATLMKRILQRGYSPGWIEAGKDSIWEDQQVAALRERIRYSKAGGEELFLENAQWHPMGFTPMDSGIADQAMMTKRDIASVFHVDPALIGDVSTRTYATYQQSRLALYMEAVLPHLRLFRDDWNRTIGNELESALYFDRDSFDAITQPRSEATDRVHKLWTSGLISQNEARRDLEYDEVPDGDVFYLPGNMVPMGEGEPQKPE